MSLKIDEILSEANTTKAVLNATIKNINKVLNLTENGLCLNTKEDAISTVEFFNVSTSGLVSLCSKCLQAINELNLIYKKREDELKAIINKKEQQLSLKVKTDIINYN